MKDDTFFYDGELFRTGDLISCCWEGHTIDEAKIYICSQLEKEQVTIYHDNFVVIVFICNNIVNHYIRQFSPDYLGYKYIIGTAYRKHTGDLNPWSDGIYNIKKLIIKDHLLYTIDKIIFSDKQAIEKGVLKYVR